MRTVAIAARGITLFGTLLAVCLLIPTDAATAQGFKVGRDKTRPEILKTDKRLKRYSQLYPAGIRKYNTSLSAICPCLLIHAVPLGKNKGKVYVRDPRDAKDMTKDERKAFPKKLRDRKAKDLCDCYAKHRIGCNLIWELSQSKKDINLWRSKTQKGNDGQSRHYRGNVTWNFKNTLSPPLHVGKGTTTPPHAPVEVMLGHELAHAYTWMKAGYPNRPRTEAEEIEASHAENQIRAELAELEVGKNKTDKVRLVRLSPRAEYDYNGKPLNITGTKEVISKEDLLKCPKKVGLFIPGWPGQDPPQDPSGEEKQYAIATQVPEVCVGTTYTITEGTVLEEEVPLVTEDDEEDPRDVPQEEVPVASVPNEGDDPRDVPTEDIPVVSTPEDSDDPRDTPQEDVPVVSVPKDGDEPKDVPKQDVPVSSTPEEEGEPEDEEIDLGLVKAEERIVELALVDKADGEPVTNVAVKILAEEPPLPGGATVDVAFEADSFFEDDVDGGFTSEDGSVQLASLTTLASAPDSPRTGEADKPGAKDDLRSSSDVQKDIDAARKASMKEFAKQDAIIKRLRTDDADYKAAEEKIDKARDAELNTAKEEADKKRREIEGFQGVGKDAKKGMLEQVDKDLTKKDNKIRTGAEEKRQAALERALERAPVDVRSEFEDAGVKARKGSDKIDTLKAEKKEAEAREKKLAEPRPAPEGIPLPGNLAKADPNKTQGEGRALKVAVDREPREQLVVGLAMDKSDGDAFSAAMANPDLAARVTNMFSIGDQSFLVLAAPRSDMPALKTRIQKEATISWFEPDPCRDKEDIDDPYFNEAGLWGQDFDDQWAIKKVGFTNSLLSRAGKQANAQPTIVAVIDTGVDWYHPDFNEDSLWRNEDEIPSNGLDDDQNGYVDDIIGWNFVRHSNRPWDHDGHGTFVAGVIAAATNNGVGIAGVNPHARIMPLKALDAFGRGHASAIAEAIAYAADNGAKVINLSLGGRGLTRIEKIAVDHANAAGALVVVAAGNDAADVAQQSPAGLDGVITVSATDRRNRRAGFSNWGEEVDISAPGVDVLSLRARKTDLLSYIRGVKYDLGAGVVGTGRAYYRASGTSFATPIVSGAASLLMSLRPELSAEEVRRILLNAAADIETPGFDNFAGYGLLDVDAALKADPAFNIESRITAAKPVRLDGKSVLRLVGTADADAFDEASISLGKGKEPSKWLTIKQRITSPVQDGVLMDIPAAALSGSKAWTIRLITKHKNGTEREFRFAVTLG